MDQLRDFALGAIVIILCIVGIIGVIAVLYGNDERGSGPYRGGGGSGGEEPKRGTGEEREE